MDRKVGVTVFILVMLIIGVGIGFVTFQAGLQEAAQRIDLGSMGNTTFAIPYAIFATLSIMCFLCGFVFLSPIGKWLFKEDVRLSK